MRSPAFRQIEERMVAALQAPEEIVTRRLRLRRYREQDSDAFRGLMADDEAARYFSRPASDAAGALLQLASLYDSPVEAFSLAITILGVDRLVGACGFRPAPEPGTLEVFFSLLPSATGHGYATEAVAALVEHARTLGRRRLIARIADDSQASVGVLERAGFTLVEHDGDEFTPASIYALTL
jgi:RimJ/RimL family protein N-acetyltransferase